MIRTIVIVGLMIFTAHQFSKRYPVGTDTFFLIVSLINLHHAVTHPYAIVGRLFWVGCVALTFSNLSHSKRQQRERDASD